MKRYLLLIIMSVLVSIGTWADPTITDNGNGMITLDGLAAGDLAKDPSTVFSANVDKLATATKVVFGSDVTLNNDDLAALKTLIPAAKQLNMAQVELDEEADIANLETAAVEYLRLPNSMTGEEDVKTMASLKSKNSALKMVGAYDPDNQDMSDSSKKWAEVSLHSFEANTVTDFLAAMDMPTSGNPTVVPRRIKMSGEYGDKDLVSNGAEGTPNFGHGTSAEWDFTGAHFADCTIPATDAAYYNYNDPFLEGGLVANTTSSNSFYYFSQYKTQVVDIKLPDTNMTNLPYRCLNDLGSANKTGYVALYGQSAFDDNKAEENCVPLETLVIPDCYTDLEEECGKWARIRHLVIGSNMKRIHGGAFLKCDYLEDLDFAAGLSDCYVGDRSFNECKSMKHIALSEGIVSLGNGAFWNSQHLESIRLPQSLINMGNNCFNNCLALNSITIPENVEKIGQGAFILCPFTDIYLTTTDPAKIPIIWSAGISPEGNGFGSYDGKATFYHMHLDGWDGIPDTPQKATIEAMSWDEAVTWYYINVNGIPVLHYPTQLADAVRASISSTYEGTSTDGYGLPFRSDMYKRSNVEGADLGTVGTGKYTKDGWAQFMLMKELTSGPGSEIYQKEYDDVWYTMCFPFDLTDEQLAAAFNETFNIVDFSGVEVVEKEDNDGQSMKLVLHFNNVAVTDYKDNNGNHYERKKDNNGNVIREKDATSGFEYNVYTKKGDTSGLEYHHVNVSSFLSSNKTKTFRPSNSSSNDDVVIIDGVLATAGHPYMIHPAIGVVAGQPKQRCTFAGIEWKGMTTWEQLFKDNSRTIDLGIKKTLEELPDSNYNHPGYDGYAGQTYTFIGNSNDYITEGAPEAPTIANGRLHDYPTKPTKAAYPTEPVAVPEPTITLADYEAQNKPAVVDDPGSPTANEQTLYSHLTDGQGEHNRGCWYQETEITATYNDGSEQFIKWNTINTYTYQNDPGINLYGGDAAKEASFNLCKASFNKCVKAEAYAKYLVDLEAYNNAYADLESQWAAYNAFDPAAFANEHSQWEQDCQDIDDAYDTAYTQWQSDCADVDTYNDGVYAAWEVEVAGYRRQIPEHAYFLGRKAGQLPKYYREVAAEEYPAPSTRTGGFWTQFTAVIVPNTAAINGIEKGISYSQAHSKGFDMLFNEDFDGTYIDKDDPDVITAIENAKKEGADVKYVDIVVSINGQVVRRGSTSIEGLPKGIYIINGKKYFVK